MVVVDSMLDFYSDDLTAVFSVKLCLKTTKIKRGRGWHIKKSTNQNV